MSAREAGSPRVAAAPAPDHPGDGFVEAVVRQVAHPLHATPIPVAERVARESPVRDVVHAVLEAAAAGAGSELFSAMAETLTGSPRLLSALFQNLDLLPEGDATTDGVALLIATALDR